MSLRHGHNNVINARVHIQFSHMVLMPYAHVWQWWYHCANQNSIIIRRLSLLAQYHMCTSHLVLERCFPDTLAIGLATLVIATTILLTIQNIRCQSTIHKTRLVCSCLFIIGLFIIATN